MGIDYYTTTAYTNYATFNGSLSTNAFYMEVYKIGRLVNFVIKVGIENSNDAAWKIKINKYPMLQTACHCFSAFKGTGTAIPCYSDGNGFIVIQAGTGKYNCVIQGSYTT